MISSVPTTTMDTTTMDTTTSPVMASSSQPSVMSGLEESNSVSGVFDSITTAPSSAFPPTVDQTEIGGPFEKSNVVRDSQEPECLSKWRIEHQEILKRKDE